MDTGQHYDYTLHQVHYDQLGVPPPDVYLGVGSASHAEQTAAILTAAEQWIDANHPRAAVVIGDTNSTLACALAAAKARVPVAHVEAGLRVTDLLMAEEINRRCVDAIAAVLFAPSRQAEATLRRERADAEIHLAGDVALDVLLGAMRRVGKPERTPEEYIYVTLHRAELERAGCGSSARVQQREPVGYLESLALLTSARAVVTDSGGIQREAYWSGVPCVTVRAETEWVETVACGANRLVPPAQSAQLADAVEEALAVERGEWDKTAYGDGTAAERIAAILAERFPSSSA